MHKTTMSKHLFAGSLPKQQLPSDAYSLNWHESDRICIVHVLVENLL